MKPMPIPLDFPRINTPKGTMFCSSLRPGDWLQRVSDGEHEPRRYTNAVVTINSSRLSKAVIRHNYDGLEHQIMHGPLADHYRFIGHGKRRKWVFGWLKKLFCQFSMPQ